MADDKGMSREYIDEIQSRFNELLDGMTTGHNKVTVFRMDSHFPDGFVMKNKMANDEQSQLMKRLKENCTRRGVDMSYLWCREQNNSENPHYHTIAMVDGSKVQNAMGLLKDANRIWKNITESEKDGLIHYCNRGENGQKATPNATIRRPSSKATGAQRTEQEQAFEEACRQARERAAYLAKAETKRGSTRIAGTANAKFRQFGSSER